MRGQADEAPVALDQPVVLTLDRWWAFEVGGGTLVRLEQAEQVVLVAASEEREGGLVHVCALPEDDAAQEPVGRPTDTSRPLTYALGDTIHYGDRSVTAPDPVVEVDVARMERPCVASMCCHICDRKPCTACVSSGSLGIRKVPQQRRWRHR